VSAPAARSANRRHDREYFYKYLSPSAIKAVLRTKSLRWSSPQIFNDPFDVPRKLTFDCTARELQEALAGELARLIETHAATPSEAPPNLAYLLAVANGKSEEQRARVVHDLRTEALKAIPEPAVGFQGFRDHWDQRIPTMRVLCLSESPHSAVMWAHYAESHRGAVLEMKCADAVDSPLLAARSVRYQNDPPRLPPKNDWVQSLIGHKPIDLGEFFTDYQYIKSLQWQYETEWRVISYAREGETGLYGDYSFSREELSRVILGSECTPTDEREIGDLVAAQYPDATVVKARINQDLRRIEF
jgi:hypothetical protein